jgi:hypothetical protein
MDMNIFIKPEDIVLKNDLTGKSSLYFIGNGEEIQVMPKRLFPLTNPAAYINFLDTDNRDLGILKNVKNLSHECREFLENFLDQYYFIPKILEIHSLTEEFGMGHWTVSTDRGEREFDVRNRNTDIKPIKGRRILIKDADENTYEITDYSMLPAKSRALLEGEI